MSFFSPQINTPTYAASPFPQHNNQTSTPVKKHSHCKNERCLLILSDAKKFHKSLYFKGSELKIVKQSLNETLEENKKLKEEIAAMKKKKVLISTQNYHLLKQFHQLLHRSARGDRLWELLQKGGSGVALLC